MENLNFYSLILSGIISYFVSYLTVQIASKRNQKIELDRQLDDILKIALQYPFVESPDFIKNWDNRNCYNDEYARYDLYCTLLFNYLERFCKYYEYDYDVIQSKLNVRDWVRTHKKYWEQPDTPFENVDSYENKFRELIKGMLE